MATVTVTLPASAAVTGGDFGERGWESVPAHASTNNIPAAFLEGEDSGYVYSVLAYPAGGGFPAEVVVDIRNSSAGAVDFLSSIETGGQLRLTVGSTEHVFDFPERTDRTPNARPYSFLNTALLAQLPGFSSPLYEATLVIDNAPVVPATTHEGAATGTFEVGSSGTAAGDLLQVHQAGATGTFEVGSSGTAAGDLLQVHQAGATGTSEVGSSGAAAGDLVQVHQAGATGTFEVGSSGTAAGDLLQVHQAGATGTSEVGSSGAAAGDLGEAGETHSVAATGTSEIGSSGTAEADIRSVTPGGQGAFYGDEETGDVWVRHGAGWHRLMALDPSGKQRWYFRRNTPQNSLGVDGDNCYKWLTGEWFIKAAGAWAVKEDLTGLPGFGGSDGQGVEYIFTSKANAVPITGAANLPLQSQNYDVDALRTDAGLVRGTQKYYDGTPPDLSRSRPYLIRFRRKVPGQPDLNENIGNVPWTQEEPLLVVGQDGYGEQSIFKRTATNSAPANPTPADLTTAAYQADNHVPSTWTNNPTGTDDDFPYEWECRRLRLTGGMWGRYEGPSTWSIPGLDGAEGLGQEYIFTSKANAVPITGAANLPLQSQNYDVDALRTDAGLVRGTQKYYDGTPPDISDDRPYLIRFRRKVPGQPDQNENIGNVPWTQERALRVAGFDGQTIEFIYLRKDTPGEPSQVSTSAAARNQNGHLPVVDAIQTTDEPVSAIASARYVFEARRRRASSLVPWGEFSGWTRVDTYIDPSTGEVQPAVFSGQEVPAQSLGFENDTYVQVTGIGSAGRLGVHKKIGGAWVRVSGNPDSATWTTGSGAPTSSAANGSYYGDNETGNVWVRHGSTWYWAIDLDPSGDVTWRFGSGSPANSLGSNGDRYYRWSNGVWYEKSGGRYLIRGDLTTGYGTARAGGYYPRPCEPKHNLSEAGVEISWCAPRHAAYHASGARAELAGYVGAVYKISGTVPVIGTTPILSADASSAVLTGLEPNTNYGYRFYAVYTDGTNNFLSNVAPDGGPGSADPALRGLVGSAFTTGSITLSSTKLESTSGSGDAGRFENTSGTDNRVEVAGNSYPLVVRSGASAAEVLRIEESGHLRSEGEVFADDMSASSDRRLKTDITKIDSALDKLEKLSGYTFIKKGRANAGLIAQEVQAVLPEAVSQNGDYLTLSPSAMQALIVEAIKELREEIQRGAA